MIPPRGCAYICMVHRQDAYRARQKLSTGSFKIGSKVIKVPLADQPTDAILPFCHFPSCVHGQIGSSQNLGGPVPFKQY